MNKLLPYIFLPTDKASSIYKIGNDDKIYNGKRSHYADSKRVHLYILSDDEAKEGDWYLHPNNSSISLYGKDEFVGDAERKASKKIIATTNPELTKGWIKDNDPERKSHKTDLVTMKGIPTIFQSDIEYIISLYNGKGKEVDVEKLADDYMKEVGKDAEWKGFVDGYNQCLQDNTGKEFSLEDMRNCWNYAGDFLNEKTDYTKMMNFDKFIQSLTKEQPKSDTVLVEYNHGTGVFKGVNSIPKIKDGCIVIVRD